MRTVENPLVNVRVEVDIQQYKRALLKVVYELACIWLGYAYLDDPTAGVLRNVILGRTPLDGSAVEGEVTIGAEHPALRFWAAEPNSLVAYAFPLADGRLTVSLKVFGSVSGSILITERARAYVHGEFDPERVRLVHIDAAKGVMRHTSLLDEFKRISCEDDLGWLAQAHPAA